MNFLSFITSKTFFKHLGIILGVIFVLMFLLIKSLNSYTGQGDYILVPQLNSFDGDSLVANSDMNFLEFVITDSIFDAKARPGGVSRQNPLPGAKVKKGRKIYITIVTKGRELVSMPNLVDLSIRRAIDVVYQSRLEVNQLIFVDNFARNAVLAQLIRQDTIAPDEMILVGTPVNLVIGNGHNPGGVIIPFLIGKTAEEARDIIFKSSLNFGGADTLYSTSKEDLRVFQQYPAFSSRKNAFLGDEIRISLRSAIDFDFNSTIIHVLNDSMNDDLHTRDSLLMNANLKEF